MMETGAEATAAAASGEQATLRRIERRSLGLAAAATGVALVVPGGGVLAAAGVAGGALLAILSYLAIKRGVGAMADAILARGASEPASGGAGGRRPAVRVWAGMFVLRHALLAGIAYVMIARLRLPPVALLGGASVIVLAAAAELIGRRPPH